MTDTKPDTSNAAFAKGLREFADRLDAMPDFAILESTGWMLPKLGFYKFNKVEDARRIAALLKDYRVVEPKPDQSYMRIERSFGPLTVSFVMKRDQVCTYRQIGVKEVPVFDWECPALDEPLTAESIDGDPL